MNKGIKIALNILIFAVIAGFVWYMIHSISAKDDNQTTNQSEKADTSVSPYVKNELVKADAKIISFDIYNDNFFIVTQKSVSVATPEGNFISEFEVEENACKIKVANDKIYLLYPTKIKVYSFTGDNLGGWEACSDNSDYVSFAFTSKDVFVTDAANKNICQYTIDGNFVKFINSPDGFVIPSYSFDIINVNDTLYCTNSGRHKIEKYTSNGEFISSWGKTGNDVGAFAGCCNPVYLAVNSYGDIITSEKGNSRISCFDKNGNFKTVLLDSKVLTSNKAYNICFQDNVLYTSEGNVIFEYVIKEEYSYSEKSTAECSGTCSNCTLSKCVFQ